MSDALSTWTNRVIELRARAISVKQTREQKILHSTFSHWINKSRQNIENLSLVDSFIEVQEEDLIRNKFKTWLFNTKRKIRLRELLEDKLKEDEKNLVAGIFDRWIDVYKERQLIDQVSFRKWNRKIRQLCNRDNANLTHFASLSSHFPFHVGNGHCPIQDLSKSRYNTSKVEVKDNGKQSKPQSQSINLTRISS